MPSSPAIEKYLPEGRSAGPALSGPDRLCQAISNDIAQGIWPVGSRLPPEAELCVHYKVSRTMLREAVARLRADGVIDAQQGRGSFVLRQSLRTPFRFDASLASSQNGIAQLAELRLGVEGMAAALAAERRTPAQLARLADYLAQMGQAIQSGTSGNEADLAFHQTIAEATGNDHYRAFMAYLRQFYSVAIATARANSASRPSLSNQAQEEHAAIYRAIAAQEPQAAQEAVLAHIRNAARRLAAP